MSLLVLAAAGALLWGPAAAGACTRGLTTDPRVPTWGAVNGFRLGAREATDQQIGAYMLAVAREASRVATGVAGTSTQGRPLRYAVVADPSVFGGTRRAAVLRDLASMRDGATGGARAALIARRDPAIVWIAGSVHSNEPSGADADMALLRELAARRDCAERALLRRLVVVMLPVQNPDGRAAGTRESATGFDLNRDWFADTQPETAARLRLLRELPPVALDDQHEQGGRTAFVPPYAPPINRELASGALRAIDSTFAPALRATFKRRGWAVASGSPFDLLYPGYADAATSLLLGAAGMTVEVGGDAPYATRVAQHLAAAEAVVEAAARDKVALLRNWAAGAREARAQGSQGRLQGSARRVYAYVLAPSPGAGALVSRLIAQGVAVDRLRAPLRVARLDPFGAAGPGAATSAAGTYVVPMTQAAKHWIDALLGDDARAAAPSAYDVNAWAEPLLMGLSGGALLTPLPRAAVLQRMEGPAPVTVGAPSLGGYLLRGDDARSLGLGIDLLQHGAALRRVPGSGDIVVAPGSDAAVAAGAVARGAGATPLAPAPAPSRSVPLRPVKVALLGAGRTTSAVPPGAPIPTQSPDWCRWVLEARFGLHADVLGHAELAAGRLTAGGYTTLVVPDGEDPLGGLGPAALAQVQAFVRGGGRYIGWRSRGVTIAAAAGLTEARADRPPGLTVPGSAVEVRLDPASPLAWGTGGSVYALDDDDPVLRPGGGGVGRYPPARRLWHSGYLAGAALLGGTAAVLDAPFGAGDVVLFSFDPAFRGYADGTERLLANALLAPLPSAAA